MPKHKLSLLFISLLVTLLLSPFFSFNSVVSAQNGSFGKTSAGSVSHKWSGGNDLVGCVFTCPENGIADSISVCISVTGCYFRCAIYFNSNLSKLGETVELYVATASKNWKTFSFSEPKPSLTSGFEYLLCVWGSVQYYTWYSSGDTNQTSRDVEIYNGFPATFSKDASWDEEQSIYCSYTAAGGQEYDRSINQTYSFNLGLARERALSFGVDQAYSWNLQLSPLRALQYSIAETYSWNLALSYLRGYYYSLDQPYVWVPSLSAEFDVLEEFFRTISQLYGFDLDLDLSTQGAAGPWGSNYVYYSIDSSVDLIFLGPRVIHSTFQQYLEERVPVTVTIVIQNREYGGDLQFSYRVEDPKGAVVKEGTHELELGPESQQRISFSFTTKFSKHSKPKRFTVIAEVQRMGSRIGDPVEHKIVVAHVNWAPHLYNLIFLSVIGAVVGLAYIGYRSYSRREEESHG